MEETYETIIIGAGVAGMTAALYLKRAGNDVLVLEKEAPGGQITRTASIENYPGFSSIEGPELAMKMYEQLMDLKVPIVFSEVLEIIPKNNQYQVIANQKKYLVNNLILSTGRNPKKLNILNEQKLTGKGISWCAICDGPLYRGKQVAVIGGGRAALEESLYLSKICDNVTLIHRRDEFRADNELVEKVKQAENIDVRLNAEVTEFLEEDGKLSGVKLSGENRDILEIAGCFEFIGQEPSTKIFKNLDILDQDGYIQVNSNLETSLNHVYACGDCIKKELYQIITACSDGAIVANKILNQ